MEIRIRNNGQVVFQDEWRKWVAQTYGKAVGPITPEVLEMFESDAIFEGPQAIGGTVYQYSMRQGVEQQSDGKWYTKYVLGPIFENAEDEAAYKAQKDAEHAENVRKDRNQRLSDCDWTQLSDSPVDKTAWATYRQALRDVPTQTGFPWNVTWPNKPE